MRYTLCLAVLLCAGCASRELTGDSLRLSPDQLVWLEQRIEAGFAEVPVIAGSTVAEGKIIVRADGEVISSRSIMQAAKRGLARSGASETEKGDATLLIQGEINVNAFQEDRRSATRYICSTTSRNLRFVRRFRRGVRGVRGEALQQQQNSPAKPKMNLGSGFAGL